MKTIVLGWGVLFALVLAACGKPQESATQTPAAEPAAAPASTEPAIATIPERNAYFGDLHVHTRYSFDAFIFGTRASPDDAYRYAKGEAVMHPAGIEMKMPAPLDFQAVTDHDIYLGMLPAMDDPSTKVGQHEIAVAIREAKTPVERRAAFKTSRRSEEPMPILASRMM